MSSEAESFLGVRSAEPKAATWRAWIDGAEFSPYTVSELRTHRVQERITDETQIAPVGSEDWKPLLEHLPDLMNPKPQIPQDRLTMRPRVIGPEPELPNAINIPAGILFIAGALSLGFGLLMSPSVADVGIVNLHALGTKLACIIGGLLADILAVQILVLGYIRNLALYATKDKWRQKTASNSRATGQTGQDGH